MKFVLQSNESSKNDKDKSKKHLQPIFMFNSSKKNKKDNFLDSIMENLKGKINRNNGRFHTSNLPNYFNSTNLSKLNSTHQDYLPLSTLRSIKNNSILIMNTNSNYYNTTVTNYNETEMDHEIESLCRYYYDVNLIKDENKNKSHKKEVFSKYKIKDKLTYDEKDTIKSLMRTGGEDLHDYNNTITNNTNMNIQKTNPTNNVSLMSKTLIKLDTDDYKHPMGALKKLKMNKQIHDNVVNIVTNRQIQLYKEKFTDSMALKEKLDRMPKARISSDMHTRIKEKMLENDPINMITISSRADKNENEGNTVADHNYQGKSKKAMKSYRMLSREDLLSNTDYHGSPGSFTKFRPAARYQTTMTQTKDGSVYLIGGINNNRLFDVWKCDLNTLCWKSIKVTGETPLPRMGHSAVLYKNLIFIFGGNIEQEPKMPKEDITIFNIERGRILVEKCSNKSNVLWRRNHIAVCVGFNMLIHGGIDEEGEFLSDTMILDLDSLKWNTALLKEDQFKPFPVAYHSTAVVLTSGKRNCSQYSVYKFPDLMRDPINNIKHEGVYIFGGINKDGICNNLIRVIKLGKRPLEWLKLNYHGIPPCPRHSATLSFFEELEVLIVHGGRDDKCPQIVFCDTFIFDLYNLNWIKINVFETNPPLRAEHSAVVFNNKLIIFGGINHEAFVGSEIFLVDLDYFDNKRKKNEYDILIGNKKKILSQFELPSYNDESLENTPEPVSPKKKTFINNPSSKSINKSPVKQQMKESSKSLESYQKLKFKMKERLIGICKVDVKPKIKESGVVKFKLLELEK